MIPNSLATVMCDQILKYMRYGEGKLERRENLVEGEREKKKRKMEVQGSCASVFLFLKYHGLQLSPTTKIFVLKN